MARRHCHSIRLAAATRILALLALLPLGVVWALGEGADLQRLRWSGPARATNRPTRAG